MSLNVRDLGTSPKHLAITVEIIEVVPVAPGHYIIFWGAMRFMSVLLKLPKR